MNIKNFKALLFDFGGTIDFDEIDWKNRLINFFKESKILVEREKVLKASIQAMKMLEEDKSSKNLTYKQTVEIFIYWTIKKSFIDN